MCIKLRWQRRWPPFLQSTLVAIFMSASYDCRSNQKQKHKKRIFYVQNYDHVPTHTVQARQRCLKNHSYYDDIQICEHTVSQNVACSFQMWFVFLLLLLLWIKLPRATRWVSVGSNFCCQNENFVRLNTKSSFYLPMQKVTTDNEKIALCTRQQRHKLWGI